MGRIREFLIGINEIINNEVGDENLNKEDEELLALANDSSKEGIGKLERDCSGDISSPKKQKLAEGKYAVSKQKGKNPINSEKEKAKGKKAINEEIEK